MGIEHKLEYRHWLKTSDIWSESRLIALSIQGYRCRVCDKVDHRNHAHHVRYPKFRDKTHWHYLQTLCGPCHKEIHRLTTPSEYQSTSVAYDRFFEAVRYLRKLGGFKPRRKLKCRKTERRLRKNFKYVNP